ncbi:MAG TPA: hypothetical protein VFS34_06585, partial [Thermoanaerobaculia bacterium]|nr:hypothetical protein [Thermoanaerobaculia bacterium]
MSRDAPVRIDLFRDVLDKQLTDRNGEKVGKADGLIVSASSGRVEAIEAGFCTLVRRLSGRWGRAVERAAARAKTPLLRSCRVAFREVLDIGLELKLDVDGKATPLRAGERWLAERVVARVPGSGLPRPRRERDARPPAGIPEDPGEIRLELALGRRVRAKNGRAIGRLEEIRAEKRGADWIAREIRIGPAALLERLAAGTRLFGGRSPKG